MNLYQETKYLMKKYNITAQKSYGQNFLINEDIVSGIIEYSDISKDDLVFEIGPGLGNLTSKLLKKSGKVIAIELDPKMISILNDRFSLYDNFELINQDILKTDINQIINDNLKYKHFKVVANLPYYITTPIIMKLLEDKLQLDSITVMVQKEVAERLSALSDMNNTHSKKDIGSITFAIKYYTDSQIIIDVPKDNFIPSPKVDSSVIMLKILKEPSVHVKDENLLFKIIKAGFMQKRKTLVNSLVNSQTIEKDTILKILDELGIDYRIRPEQLSLEDFANIANKIS